MVAHQHRSIQFPPCTMLMNDESHKTVRFKITHWKMFILFQMLYYFIHLLIVYMYIVVADSTAADVLAHYRINF